MSKSRNNILDVLLKSKSNFVSISDQPSLITFINPYSYLLLRKNIHILEGFDFICSDGSLLTALLKILGKKGIERQSFDMTSLAKSVLYSAQQKGLRVYFIGAKQNEIECAIHNLNEHYKNLNIASYRNGYFSSDHDRDEAIKQIAESNPDIVIAGMGTIKQEQFLKTLRDNGWKGIGFTCGGFIHQTAMRGSTKYYPDIIDRTNTRFLYRMLKEPHTIKRYLMSYPLFLFFFTCDYLSQLMSTRHLEKNHS